MKVVRIFTGADNQTHFQDLDLDAFTTGRIGASAAGPPGAVWGLCGAAQPPARRDHANAAPTGRGGGRCHARVASLELGAAPEAGVCPGSGPLSSATVWAEGSAQTRCADTVAPGLATFRCAVSERCG